MVIDVVPSSSCLRNPNYKDVKQKQQISKYDQGMYYLYTIHCNKFRNPLIHKHHTIFWNLNRK